MRTEEPGTTEGRRALEGQSEIGGERIGPRSILIIEDSRADRHILRIILERSPLIHARLQYEASLSGGLRATETLPPDLILLDLNLGDSAGLDTFRRVHAVARSIPVVIITAEDEETLGVKALRLGAQDWLPKKAVHAGTLPRAVLYAFERKLIETRLAATVAELETALQKVKRLESLIPACAACRKVRDDDGYWTQVETYLCQHTHLKFTHGICPECFEQQYPEYLDLLEDSEE